jgi:hypothetical protein
MLVRLVRRDVRSPRGVGSEDVMMVGRFLQRWVKMRVAFSRHRVVSASRLMGMVKSSHDAVVGRRRSEAEIFLKSSESSLNWLPLSYVKSRSTIWKKLWCLVELMIL